MSANPLNEDESSDISSLINPSPPESPPSSPVTPPSNKSAATDGPSETPRRSEPSEQQELNRAEKGDKPTEDSEDILENGPLTATFNKKISLFGAPRNAAPTMSSSLISASGPSQHPTDGSESPESDGGAAEIDLNGTKDTDNSETVEKEVADEHMMDIERPDEDTAEKDKEGGEPAATKDNVESAESADTAEKEEPEKETTEKEKPEDATSEKEITVETTAEKEDAQEASAQTIQGDKDVGQVPDGPMDQTAVAGFGTVNATVDVQTEKDVVGSKRPGAAEAEKSAKRTRLSEDNTSKSVDTGPTIPAVAPPTPGASSQVVPEMQPAVTAISNSAPTAGAVAALPGASAATTAVVPATPGDSQPQTRPTASSVLSSAASPVHPGAASVQTDAPPSNAPPSVSASVLPSAHSAVQPAQSGRDPAGGQPSQPQTEPVHQTNPGGAPRLPPHVDAFIPVPDLHVARISYAQEVRRRLSMEPVTMFVRSMDSFDRTQKHMAELISKGQTDRAVPLMLQYDERSLAAMVPGMVHAELRREAAAILFPEKTAALLEDKKLEVAKSQHKESINTCIELRDTIDNNSGTQGDEDAGFFNRIQLCEMRLKRFETAVYAREWSSIQATRKKLDQIADLLDDINFESTMIDKYKNNNNSAIIEGFASRLRKCSEKLQEYHNLIDTCDSEKLLMCYKECQKSYKNMQAELKESYVKGVMTEKKLTELSKLCAATRDSADNLTAAVPTPVHLHFSFREWAEDIRLEAVAYYEEVTNRIEMIKSREQESANTNKLMELCSTLIEQITTTERELRTELGKSDDYVKMMRTLGKANLSDGLANVVGARQEVKSIRMSTELRELYQKTITHVFRALEQKCYLEKLLAFTLEHEGNPDRPLLRDLPQRLFSSLLPGSLCSISREAALDTVERLNIDASTLLPYKHVSSDAQESFKIHTLLNVFSAQFHVYHTIEASNQFAVLDPFYITLADLLDLFKTSDEMCSFVRAIMGSAVSITKREFINRLFNITD